MMNVILNSAVQQTDSVLHMYLIFFKFLSHVAYCRALSRVPRVTQ